MKNIFLVSKKLILNLLFLVICMEYLYIVSEFNKYPKDLALKNGGLQLFNKIIKERYKYVPYIGWILHEWIDGVFCFLMDLDFASFVFFSTFIIIINIVLKKLDISED